MARLVVEQLGKSFSGPEARPICAVDGVSFAVGESERLAIVGPSGSGKTTLLRLIAGLEEPTHGTVRIDGQEVQHRPPHERDVALVFQSGALFPHLTGFENIAFALRLRGLPRAEIESRVRDIAGTLSVSDCLSRLPEKLSTGQRQRIALARALAQRPRVLLLDEPLASLDAPLRVQLREELRHLLAMTTLFVTHDQAEALSIGDRVAVLHAGAIQQLASPQTLYRAPANLFVARFIGWPAMNLFRGRIEKRDGQAWFRVDGAGEAALPLGLLSADAPAPLSNRELILGARPEALEITAGAGAKASSHAVVRTVEPAGADSYAHLDWQGQPCVARLPARTDVKPGDSVSLRLAPSQAHFFDAGTEQAVGMEFISGW